VQRPSSVRVGRAWWPDMDTVSAMTGRGRQRPHGPGMPGRSGIAVWVLFVVAYAALMLLAYFRLPAATLSITDVGVAIALVLAALGVLLWLFVRQIRRVPTAAAPMVQSVSALVVVFVPFLLLFSYIYLSLAARDEGEMVGLRTHLDALYFTVTMLTTVGFGDISPSGQVARAVATTQMLVNLIFLGFLVRVAFQVGQEARRRRRESSPAAEKTVALGEQHEQWQASPHTAARAERDEP
jgi:voltage-gated potassium channel